MSGEAKLVNNLLNITNEDPVYKVIRRDLVAAAIKMLPAEHRKVAKAAAPYLEHVGIIAADDYFLHYSVYPMLRAENPDKILNNALKIQKEYVKGEDYRRAKVLTTLNDALSKIHAAALTAEILRKVIKEMERQLKQQAQKMGRQGLPPSLAALADRAAQGDRQARQALSQLCAQALNRVLGGQKYGAPGRAPDPAKVFSKALEKAKKAAETAKDIQGMLGGKAAGKSPGGFERVLDLTKAVMETSGADRILALGNRLAESVPLFVKIAKRRNHKYGDEIFSYRITKKPWEALPRELALPDDIFYAKWAASGFLAYEKATVAEGAYYVLIDKSGSMAGRKTIWARSVALALFKLARRKRRKYFLRLFDTAVWPHAREPPVSDPADILELILTVKSDGGTDIDHALEIALRDLRERRLDRYTNTIIIITDGEDQVTTPISAFRAASATLIAVMIQGHNDALRTLAEATGGQYLSVKPDERGGLKIIEAAKRR